jgi:hypothetical protein
MSTRPLECGTCGRDHPSAEPCAPVQQLDNGFIYGPTWTTEQLRADFHVEAFAAPFVIVRRKSDNKKGSLQFQHHPRIYFDWKET